MLDATLMTVLTDWAGPCAQASPHFISEPLMSEIWQLSATELAAVKEMSRPVVPANLMGLPSACVPAGRDEATGDPVRWLVLGWIGLSAGAVHLSPPFCGERSKFARSGNFG